MAISPRLGLRALGGLVMAVALWTSHAQGQLQTQGTSIGRPPARPGEFRTLVGVVRSVNRRTGSFTCLWRGRIRRIIVTHATRISAEGAPAGLYALKPGDTVRVDFVATKRGFVALNVSVSASMPSAPSSSGY